MLLSALFWSVEMLLWPSSPRRSLLSSSRFLLVFVLLACFPICILRLKPLIRSSIQSLLSMVQMLLPSVKEVMMMKVLRFLLALNGILHWLLSPFLPAKPERLNQEPAKPEKMILEPAKPEKMSE